MFTCNATSDCDIKSPNPHETTTCQACAFQYCDFHFECPVCSLPSLGFPPRSSKQDIQRFKEWAIEELKKKFPESMNILESQSDEPSKNQRGLDQWF